MEGTKPVVIFNYFYNIEFYKRGNFQNLSRINPFQSSYLNVKVQEFNSMQTLIFRLTKKFNIRIDKRNSLEFMEEDALHLDTLYRKERSLHPTFEVACAICNVEKIEQNLVVEMQREIEVTKLARNFFMIMDCYKYYSLCLRHRAFYANYSPKCFIGCPFPKNTRWNYPEDYVGKQFGSIDNQLVKTTELNSLTKNNDVFYIPTGENPAEYMALHYNWSEYLKHIKMPETRMPYTNSIKLEDSDQNFN